MSSDEQLSNPSFYISVVSSIAFGVSEVLPFFSNKSNGIVHSIAVYLSSMKNNTVIDNKNSKNNLIELKEVVIIKDKLDKIIDLIENKYHK
jgi:hypothetical protein